MYKDSTLLTNTNAKRKFYKAFASNATANQKFDFCTPLSVAAIFEIPFLTRSVVVSSNGDRDCRMQAGNESIEDTLFEAQT